MGRLGLELSKSTWVSSAANKPKQEVSFRDIPMTATNVEEKDGPFDKVMAYASYYALVFVACCVFIPTQTSFVFAATTELVAPSLNLVQQTQISEPHVTNVQGLPNAADVSSWTLRDTN